MPYAIQKSLTSISDRWRGTRVRARSQHTRLCGSNARPYVACVRLPFTFIEFQFAFAFVSSRCLCFTPAYGRRRFHNAWPLFSRRTSFHQYTFDAYRTVREALLEHRTPLPGHSKIGGTKFAQTHENSMTRREFHLKLRTKKIELMKCLLSVRLIGHRHVKRVRSWTEGPNRGSNISKIFNFFYVIKWVIWLVSVL